MKVVECYTRFTGLQGKHGHRRVWFALHWPCVCVVYHIATTQHIQITRRAAVTLGMGVMGSYPSVKFSVQGRKRGREGTKMHFTHAIFVSASLKHSGRQPYSTWTNSARKASTLFEERIFSQVVYLGRHDVIDRRFHLYFKVQICILQVIKTGAREDTPTQ